MKYQARKLSTIIDCFMALNTEWRDKQINIMMTAAVRRHAKINKKMEAMSGKTNVWLF